VAAAAELNRQTAGPRESGECPTGAKDVVAMFAGVTQIAMKKAPTIVMIYRMLKLLMGECQKRRFSGHGICDHG
jgi:hypothetical protein